MLAWIGSYVKGSYTLAITVHIECLWLRTADRGGKIW